MTRVLGIDPGYASVGWAVMDLAPLAVVDVGLIRTERSAKKLRILVSDDNMNRARHVARLLLALVNAHRPIAICTEGPAGSQSYGAAFAAGAGTALVGSLAVFADIPVCQVSQQELKVRVAGARDASKEAIAAAIAKRFPEAALLIRQRFPAKDKQEHPFDAIGCVLACLDSDVLQMARKVAA